MFAIYTNSRYKNKAKLSFNNYKTNSLKFRLYKHLIQLGA